ncbi:MAG: potassium channel protein [Desulfobacteraceae bacterium]|nr:MAG: potassium channel protein [Desulfobacteraceae bacterium]
MDIKKRLYLIQASILLIIVLGSLGYYILFNGHESFMDCLFMTVISLTTVGYGEVIAVTGNPVAQIFTMVLITFGMGIILYGISTLTAILIEGELTQILRKRKMQKAIEKLSHHYILCGGGETGRPLLHELAKSQEPIVLIESDKKHIDLSLEILPELLYIEGDATDDQNLIRAGIKDAAGIIIAIPWDRDNLYITMSARMLNPTIRIVTRMTDPKIEPKFRKAGADSVVSPNFIGALRMASEMIRPAAVDFLDQMLRSGDGNLRIHELKISPHSPLAGKTILESGLKSKFDLLVLGAKDAKGNITFNPPPDQTMDHQTTFIIMGDIRNIKKMRDISNVG